MNGEHCFTITHPFHPLCGQTFLLLSQRFAWGEERVFFSDPQTHQVRSYPKLGRAWPCLILSSLWLLAKPCYVLVTYNNSCSYSGRSRPTVRRSTNMVQHVTAHHDLLELCALIHTLLLDEEGLYVPSTFNDRLLLGFYVRYHLERSGR